MAQLWTANGIVGSTPARQQQYGPLGNSNGPPVDGPDKKGGPPICGGVMDLENLVRLSNATGYAIAMLKDIRCESVEDVNWESLRCSHASWVVTDQGQEYAQVLIKGASPDSKQVKADIWREVAELGWGNVQVLTEW